MTQPPIGNQKEYIEWFLRNSKDIHHCRKYYEINKFVEVFSEIVTTLLNDYPSADKLFERVGDFAVTYEKMKPLIEKRGGFNNEPDMFQNSATELLVKISIGEEFLIKKYNHKESIRLKEIYSK